ncbi:MAG TPA: hypothetical protein VK826_18615 [Bacteroidia bacterium]|nr:hypothetical protein [Bacteroidia bacterium]
MIDEATYSELDRYFHSRMNADERSAFEIQMNASEELRAELSWLLSMQKSMSTQGKAVMKQVVAGAISGIPDKTVAKYKPSINGKSFLQKWWWVIAAGTVILAAAAWFAVKHYATQQEHCLDCTEQGGLVAPDTSANIDSLIAGMTAIDSACLDDSAWSEKTVGPAGNKEVVLVNLTGDFDNKRLPESEIAKKTPIVIVDSVARFVNAYGWETKRPDSVNKERPTDILCRPDPYASPAYTYDGRQLTLFGPYSTAKGLTFSAQGDSLIMRDSQPGYFVLKKVIKQKPLVRKIPSAK